MSECEKYKRSFFSSFFLFFLLRLQLSFFALFLSFFWRHSINTSFFVTTMIHYFIPSLVVAAGMVLAQSSTSVTQASASAPSASQPTGTTTTGSAMAQSSPAWLSDVKPLPGNVQSYPSGTQVPTGPFAGGNITLQGYPPGWKSPPTDSPQVQAAYNAIDWSLVPNSTVQSGNKDGTPSMSGYDAQNDPECWWTATGCTTPKHEHVPADTLNCPAVGDWGLVRIDTMKTKPLTNSNTFIYLM
jgi:hypothetical protein